MTAKLDIVIQTNHFTQYLRFISRHPLALSGFNPLIPMGPKYELVISVVRVRQLPERLFRGSGREHQPSRLSNSKPVKTLYAKGAAIRPGHDGGEPEQSIAKVTGPGVWDYGKQGDATWGK